MQVCVQRACADMSRYESAAAVCECDEALRGARLLARKGDECRVRRLAGRCVQTGTQIEVTLCVTWVVGPRGHFSHLPGLPYTI